MKTYGSPVNLPTEAVSEDYELRHNEKARIKRSDYGTLHSYPEWTAEAIEEKALENLQSEFTDNPEVTLLYAKVEAILQQPKIGQVTIISEVHIQSNHPFGIGMAVAIVILAIGFAIAVWIGVMAYGTYRFVEASEGWGGGIAMILMFGLAILFLLLIFGGKLGIGGKKGLKIGK